MFETNSLFLVKSRYLNNERKCIRDHFDEYINIIWIKAMNSHSPCFSTYYVFFAFNVLDSFLTVIHTIIHLNVFRR